MNPHEAKEAGPLIQKITQRHGVDALGLGLAGMKQAPDWQRKREMMSPSCTPHWDELLVVKGS
ncbi:DUF4113 domain-containing protein [Paeniglutamicibacter sp. NPDC012692]|uniref:DUF4113 domain-containing protein n=1 Tax=Paeniglutamicibacter sp. NPDC012692 TaxID=3364388 RepID=UPI0036BD9E2A